MIRVYISQIGTLTYYNIEYKLSFKLEKSTAVKQTTTKNKYKIALYIVSTSLLFIVVFYSQFNILHVSTIRNNMRNRLFRFLNMKFLLQIIKS
jgi:hypothetical protein